MAPSLGGDPEDRAEILVVDDSVDNRLAIRAAIDGMAHSILEAASGEEALRILLEREIAVLLLDVRMPTIDGYETARLIRSRQRTSRVPIIFLTAFAPDDQGVLEAYRLGAVDFLFKPVQPEILRAKVAVFVDLHRNAVQIAQQAERLREHDRRRHEQELAEQRRRIEAQALRRQMAEERRINEQLMEADRRKDEFLAILGHELRNPLVPLVAGLHLISRLGTADPVVTRARAAMERQVHHLVRLVDDLLDVSRVASGRLELLKGPVAVAEVVDQAIEIVQPLIDEQKLELLVQPAGEELWLDADIVRLTQALANLLANSVRYTDPPGQIRVSWRSEEATAVIEVRDTGRGMDADMLSRAFDMFAQERPGAGGLGIGLPLARHLLQLHGGTVTAKSDGRDKGSSFELRLPIAHTSAAAYADRTASGPEPTPPAQTRTPLRVVLVEDDFDLRDTVGDVLREWGHSVELVATGREAVERILATSPDVAVVDIGLPDIDGYAVAAQLRAAPVASPVRLIAMTGFGQRRDRMRALDAGFDEHIAKPPDLDRLREVVEAAG